MKNKYNSSLEEKAINCAFLFQKSMERFLIQ